MNAPYRYRKSPTLIADGWASIIRAGPFRYYHALACQVDHRVDPLIPAIRMVRASTPDEAYEELVYLTERPWPVVTREADILELPTDRWRDLVRAAPKLRVVSDLVCRRAALIWDGAGEDPIRSQALWLALVAAHFGENSLLDDDR